MPRVKRKQKIDPDGLYRAWQSAAIGSLPGVPVVNPGMRIRGDDPRVQAAPHLFVADGADDGEVAERWVEEFEVAAEHREPVQYAGPATPVRARDLVAAIRSVEVKTPEGQWETIRAGRSVPKGHPAVEAEPEAFVEVAPEGLAREDVLVALGTMSNTDESGEVTVVYEGQWISRRHPFVAVHPHNFALPPPEQV